MKSAIAERYREGSIVRFELQLEEWEAVLGLLSRVTRKYRSIEDSDFLRRKRLFAYELPPRLLLFLEDFLNLERAAACVLSGYDVNLPRIGPTPPTWRTPTSTFREEVFLMLVAAVLGEVFGWLTLQDGRLVSDVLPIRGDEQEQSSHGSEAELAWHTEDAFHAYRGDYVGLMCMRNADGIPTTVASIDEINLDPQVQQTLSMPRFLIPPDNEHLKSKRTQDETRRVGLPDLASMKESPKPVPVLFGHPESPYTRMDPHYMRTLPGDEEAALALKTFTYQVDDALRELVIKSGEVCIIDNFRAVHGRQAFAARYDGTDRWLKKINITRDLRKSRALRHSVASRTLA